MYILVVDDQPERFAGIAHFADAVFVTTYAEAFIALDSLDVLDELWLDHDLGTEPNGMALVRDLCEEAGRMLPEERLVIKRIFVHSMNAAVNRTMVNVLNTAGFNAVLRPIHTIQ